MDDKGGHVGDTQEGLIGEDGDLVRDEELPCNCGGGATLWGLAHDVGGGQDVSCKVPYNGVLLLKNTNLWLVDL